MIVFLFGCKVGQNYPRRIIINFYLLSENLMTGPSRGNASLLRSGLLDRLTRYALEISTAIC
jgi:hypothetical protein